MCSLYDCISLVAKNDFDDDFYYMAAKNLSFNIGILSIQATRLTRSQAESICKNDDMDLVNKTNTEYLHGFLKELKLLFQA